MKIYLVTTQRKLILNFTPFEYSLQGQIEFEVEKFLSPEELTQINVDKELERSKILLVR